MPELLKNIYSKAFFTLVCEVLKEHLPAFDEKKFLNELYDRQWKDRALKERMRHITLTLRKYFPEDFQEALKILLKVTDDLKRADRKEMTLGYLFIPDFVEVYGQEDLKNSVAAMEQITPLITAEFCIRPFIIRYPEKMMKQMLVWSRHRDHHVRRLASEGCRPRLPWAMALPALKKDPSPVIPVLENLMNDESEYVRRSVANNLNDIAKDHPSVVLKLAERWIGKSEQTDKIFKHGCRTLLKTAHPVALKHFGFRSCKVEVSGLKVSNRKLKIGDTLQFDFSVKLLQKAAARLRLEYAVYYVKSSGKVSRKIFQITESEFAPGRQHYFSRSRRFTDFTTRKHYPGKHKIGIVVNGVEQAEAVFMLAG